MKLSDLIVRLKELNMEKGELDLNILICKQDNGQLVLVNIANGMISLEDMSRLSKIISRKQ